jgi:hypothetical protein
VRIRPRHTLLRLPPVLAAHRFIVEKAVSYFKSTWLGIPVPFSILE